MNFSVMWFVLFALFFTTNQNNQPLNEEKNRNITIGAQYAPVVKATEVPRELWESDIKQMKDLNLTTIRAFVAWDRIEKVEGVRDYEDLDYLFELAEKYDLNILLTIGGVFDNLVSLYPPRWLLRNYDVQPPLITQNDQLINNYGPRKKIVFNDPIYQAKAKDFLVETIKRYSKSPQLEGWIIWNEPHWEGSFDQYTLANYRQWLKNKYKNIEDLNKAWSTEFPVSYTSFDDVEPQIKTGFSYGGYVPWVDWKIFCTDNLNEKIDWISKIVSENDNFNHFKTINFTPLDVQNESVNRNTNVYKSNLHLNELGYSWYELGTKDGRQLAEDLSRIRGFSSKKDKTFKIIETAAGPVYWIFNSDPNLNSTRKRIMRNWQAIAHGSRSIIYWLYRTRTSDAQSGEFGLVNWDGSINERAQAFGNMANILKENDYIFGNLKYNSEAAILLSKSNMLLGYAEGFEKKEDLEYIQRSQSGAYKTLFDLGIQADFIPEEKALEGNLEEYKVLFIPFHPYLSNSLIEKLKDYVKKGGLIVTEIPFGMKNEKGRLNFRAPSENFREIFKCYYNNMNPALSYDTIFYNKNILDDYITTTHIFKQPLQCLSKDVNIIGKDKDGNPMIVYESYKKGGILMAGTSLFIKYLENSDQSYLDLIRITLNEQGVERKFQINNLDKISLSDQIEVAKLENVNSTQSKDVYFVINHSDSKINFDLLLNKGNYKSEGKLNDFINDQLLDFSLNQNHISMNISLSGKGVIGFQL